MAGSLANKSSAQLSAPAKAAMGLFAGAGILGSVWLLKPDKTVFLILLGAVLLILLLLLIYHLVAKWLGARKAAPFTSSVTQAAGSTPNSISALASRAKLDDLRKNFETGVTKFTAAGKDLYQLPWYLLIGESGSGKTEAIRHSGIPFPPGLHDQLQGAGGTVNMNWWFTNEAVIVDTAGRYLFEEVQPGTSGEWTEFLRLLSQNRPQCPINGLLLVIPANSLILDTADKIEAKAGKIAQQLDRIQRTLDIRFPVYVVVTKCDLINGFREFFDGFTEQRQQHQILGWSNPAPLDEPFNPELVDQHLKTVHTRLMQRRMGLLLDPIARESADARRVDEVDALYSLPDSFLRIGPRLRQYLEMVFVAGEWSPKPLFLRGIYFTSSMREGQALDAELAELLGVPVDSLSENRMWDRDRAFFLRDLFIKKVFPERGLVTRAVSAKKVERNRKVSLLAAGFAGTLALLGFTFLGQQQLKSSVEQQAQDWASFKDVDLAIIKEQPFVKGKTTPTFRSRLDDKAGPGTSQTVGEWQTLLLKQTLDPIYVPLVLKPAAGIIGHTVDSANIASNKTAVYRAQYGSCVLQPLADAAGKKLESAYKNDTWSPAATAALAELIHFQRSQAPDLTALFSYAVDDGPANDAFKRKYAPTLQQGLLTAGVWPQPVRIEDKSLDAGVAQFIRYWDEQIAALTAQYQTLASAGGEPAALGAAEDRLTLMCAAFAKNPPKTNAEYQVDARDWRDAVAKFNKAHQNLATKMDSLAGTGGTSSLVSLYTAAHQAATANAEQGYDDLLKVFPPGPTTTEALLSTVAPATDEVSQLRRRLSDARERLGTTIKPNIIAGLKKYDEWLLASTLPKDPGAPPQRAFVVVHQIYDVANAALPGAAPAVPPAEAHAAEDPAPQDVTKLLSDAHSAADALVTTLPDPDKRSRAAVAKSCNTVIDVLVGPKLHFDQLAAKLDKGNGSIEDLVAARAQKAPMIRPVTIPFTNIEKRSPPLKFNPKVAATVLKEQNDLITEIIKACDLPPQITKDGISVPYTLEADDLRQKAQARVAAIDDYASEYIKYYRAFLADAANPSVSRAISWQDLRKKVQENACVNVNDSLNDLGKTVSEAFKALDSTTIPALNPHADKITSGKADADNGIQALAARGDMYCKKIQNWLDLGADPDASRNTILNYTAEEFVENFIVETGASPTYPDKYWRGMTISFLRVLSDSQNQAVTNALAKLRAPNFQKFPLNLDASDHLTPADIDRIRTDVDTIILPRKPAPGSEEKANLKIGEGGRPNQGSDRLDLKLLLDKLADGGLPAADWTAIANLKNLLAAIPRAGQTNPCEISIPSVADQNKLNLAGRVSASSQFRLVQLTVNNAVAGQERGTDGQAATSLGTVDIPTNCAKGGVLFVFYADRVRFVAHQPGAWVCAPLPRAGAQAWPDPADPWQCLRYLAGNSIRNTDGTWDVELIVSVKDKPYSLWIHLKFRDAFPAKGDWPR